MPKPLTRPQSRSSRQAVVLLGRQIRLARMERRMTAQELAERADISRGLLQRIEKGDPACQIGAAFEAAAIVGVSLIGGDGTPLERQIADIERRIALLPKHTHAPKKAVDDDF